MVIVSTVSTGLALPFIKMLQVLKLFNRLRYININFGKLLTIFLEKTGAASKDQSLDPDLMMVYSGGAYHGKLTKLKVMILFLTKLHWKSLFYIISFFMRFYTKSLVKKVKALKSKKDGIITYSNVDPRVCKKIFFQRKIHFILFNMVVIDFSFFCMRTMLYMRNPMDFNGYLHIVLSYFLLTLIIQDVFYVFKSANELQKNLACYHQDILENNKMLVIKDIKSRRKKLRKKEKKKKANLDETQAPLMNQTLN